MAFEIKRGGMDHHYLQRVAKAHGRTLEQTMKTAGAEFRPDWRDCWDAVVAWGAACCAVSLFGAVYFTSALAFWYNASLDVRPARITGLVLLSVLCFVWWRYRAALRAYRAAYVVWKMSQ